MTDYFDRVCRVVIENENRIVIENSKIHFEIVKSANPQENNSRIEIYNLSRSTRKQITSSNSLVKLYAGYVNNKGLVEIGQGDMSSVRHKRSKTETVTEIYITEGLEKIKVNAVSLTLKDTVYLSTILKDLTEKTGLTFKTIGIDDSLVVQNGYAAIGSPSAVLDELSLIFQFTWSMQNGIIFIRGNKKLNGKETMLLSPYSGLILNPETVKKISRSLSKSNKPLPQDVYSVQAFLQPHLQVYDIVSVESNELKGIYQILKITHNGDTFGNDWYSDMEVVQV